VFASFGECSARADELLDSLCASLGYLWLIWFGREYVKAITVLVFTVIVWLFRRYNYSDPAAVIGVLLGSMAESSLLHTLQISGGNFHTCLKDLSPWQLWDC